MIRYSIQGDAKFHEMLAYMRNFPRILDRHIAPAMRQTLKTAKTETLKKLAPHSRTGRAVQYLEDSIFGFGSSMTGVVGWPKTKDAPWYVNILEYGARKHSLQPTGRKKNSGSQKQRARAEEQLNKKLAAGKSVKGQHVMINGQWATVAVHPGFSAVGFLAAGFSAAQSVYQAEMEKAVQNAFNEVSK